MASFPEHLHCALRPFGIINHSPLTYVCDSSSLSNMLGDVTKNHYILQLHHHAWKAHCPYSTNTIFATSTSTMMYLPVSNTHSSPLGLRQPDTTVPALGPAAAVADTTNGHFTSNHTEVLSSVLPPQTLSYQSCTFGIIRIIF